MATEFLGHRLEIEQIEHKVTILMGNTQVNQYYKAFVRECYHTLKKYVISDKEICYIR
ncbi:MAG: hypothetical protein N2201_06590 [candidate division WOR-3 bacterium]|nr:hypothetical protein [candidate division WOR-3 bacterium]